MEQLPKPQKVRTVHTVLEELWDSSDQPYVAQALEASARRSMSELGEVVSDLHRDVGREAEIDGIRLHGYDEEGNELPRYVAVAFSAYALPHKENR